MNSIYIPVLTCIYLDVIVRCMSKELTVQVEIPEIDVSKLPTRTDGRGSTVPIVNERQAAIGYLSVMDGLSRQQIAEVMDCSKGSIDQVFLHQGFKEYQQMLVQHKLGNVAVKATHRLGKLIDHKSGYVAMEAIKTALSAAGHMNKDKGNSLEISGTNVQVNIDLGG